MNEQQIQLAVVQHALSKAPLDLNQIWQNYPVLWQQLSWEQSQLRLWLRCQPDIQIEDIESDNPQYRINTQNIGCDLGETIAGIVQTLGKPMPIALLKKKLPPGIMVTDPMIKAAVKAHPQLQFKGPLVSPLC